MPRLSLLLPQRLLYGQQIEVTQESLLTFVHLADFYGIAPLLSRTSALLKEFVTIEAKNCCSKLVEASALRCTQAQQYCRGVVLRDFDAASQQRAFCQLDLSTIAELLEDDELRCDREEAVLAALSRWWDAQEPPLPASAREQLLPLVRWPLLRPTSLASVEEEHPRLASGSDGLPRLLLEGFRFHSADTSLKLTMRTSCVRCRPRVGMLSLLPLLPEGRWEGPAGFAPPPSLHSADFLTVPTSFSYVWNIPHFASLSCLSMYSPAFIVNGHSWKIYVYPRGNSARLRARWTRCTRLAPVRGPLSSPQHMQHPYLPPPACATRASVALALMSTPTPRPHPSRRRQRRQSQSLPVRLSRLGDHRQP